MKKLKSFLILLLSFTLSSAQNNIQGYFINNNGQKTACTILDNLAGTRKNFTYNLPGESEVRTADINTVKEFGIYNVYKYIRDTVEIDRSSDNDIREISKKKTPEFNKEVLFLNVLVEGKASLFVYEISGLRRFFYKTDNISINQLVYKKYEINGVIIENNSFREQLWVKLPCDSIKVEEYNVIKYQKEDLINFFKDYNKCQNTSSIVFEVVRQKADFNLTIRPRINYTSLNVTNPAYTPANSSDFESKLLPSIGIEAEVLIPKKKRGEQWSVFFEPTFNYYKADFTKPTSTIPNGTITTAVDYKAIDFPIGFRYYLKTSNQGKLFFNAMFINTIVFGSSYTLTRSDGDIFQDLKVKTPTNFAGGIGYRQGKKYSAELRYYINREILGDYSIWNSNMNSISFVIGFPLF